jgi:hypothetical protein
MHETSKTIMVRLSLCVKINELNGVPRRKNKKGILVCFHHQITFAKVV